MRLTPMHRTRASVFLTMIAFFILCTNASGADEALRGIDQVGLEVVGNSRFHPMLQKVANEKLNAVRIQVAGAGANGKVQLCLNPRNISLEITESIALPSNPSIKHSVSLW